MVAELSGMRACKAAEGTVPIGRAGARPAHTATHQRKWEQTSVGNGREALHTIHSWSGLSTCSVSSTTLVKGENRWARPQDIRARRTLAITVVNFQIEKEKFSDVKSLVPGHTAVGGEARNKIQVSSYTQALLYVVYFVALILILYLKSAVESKVT